MIFSKKQSIYLVFEAFIENIGQNLFYQLLSFHIEKIKIIMLRYN